MARLQRQYDAGYPEASATFMWLVGDVIAGSYGPRRALRLDPLRTYLRRGIIFAQGSDYFVTPFPARYGLWASRARETLLGTYGKTPWGTAESIGIRDALKSYTIWAARQLFLETKIGSLEEGKYADIAVWDCDPYTASIDRLKDMGCQLTVFNARIVYLREGTRITLSRQADSARTRP